MDWTGESSWISETSWRAGSIALAGGVCIGLALVHYTDPGVIKPNPHGVDPAVAEYLSMGRPVCEFFLVFNLRMSNCTDGVFCLSQMSSG